MSADTAAGNSFARLRKDPFFDVVVDLAVGYLSSAFDDPESVEREAWTLRALPDDGRNAECERLFTLTVGSSDVLYIERYSERGKVVDYRTVLVTSGSALIRATGYPLDTLSLMYPLLRFTPVDGSDDAVAIDWFLSDDGADDQFFELPLDERTIGPLTDRLTEAESTGRHDAEFAAFVLEELNAAE